MWVWFRNQVVAAEPMAVCYFQWEASFQQPNSPLADSVIPASIKAANDAMWLNFSKSSSGGLEMGVVIFYTKFNALDVYLKAILLLKWNLVTVNISRCMVFKIPMSSVRKHLILPFNLFSSGIGHIGIHMTARARGDYCIGTISDVRWPIY